MGTLEHTQGMCFPEALAVVKVGEIQSVLCSAVGKLGPDPRLVSGRGASPMTARPLGGGLPTALSEALSWKEGPSKSHASEKAWMGCP